MPTAAIATLMAGLLFAAPAAASTVLYDTLGSFNAASQAYIGGAADSPNNGAFWDEQLAEDFVVSAGPGFNITSVGADFRTNSSLGFNSPAHGVLVEFFNDIGGTPSAAASFAVLTQSFTLTQPDGIDFGGTGGGRFTVDLSGEGIVLGAGTWWLSIQPVDLTENGTRYNWLRLSGGANQIGHQIHRRNGGEAHGNGFPGGSGGPDWNTSFLVSGALAMSVEGTAVPAPGALALLGIAGLCGVRRRRAC